MKFKKGGVKMTVKELCEITKRSRVAIYNLARKLGRIPTVEEVLNQKVGRPRKYDY